jgi:hypothetical protein
VDIFQLSVVVVVRGYESLKTHQSGFVFMYNLRLNKVNRKAMPWCEPGEENGSKCFKLLGLRAEMANVPRRRHRPQAPGRVGGRPWQQREDRQVLNQEHASHFPGSSDHARELSSSKSPLPAAQEWPWHGTWPHGQEDGRMDRTLMRTCFLGSLLLPAL